MKFLTTLILCISLSLTSTAQVAVLRTTDPLAWQKIAEIPVNFEGGGAEIMVYEKEKYGSIHFRLLDAQLELTGADIYFDNGEQQTVLLNERLTASQHSNIIDLIGDRRILKRVVFRYKAIPRTDDKRATIQLWASKSTIVQKGFVRKTKSEAASKTPARKKLRK